MMCFRFPRTLCDKLGASALEFWWDNGSKGKGIHWVSKEIMYKEKTLGGMGFRCFESLNVALLMKQLQRICKYPDLLISKVLKAKSFRRQSVLEVEQKSS